MSMLKKWFAALVCAALHRDDWIVQPYGMNTRHGHCRECGRTWTETDA